VKRPRTNLIVRLLGAVITYSEQRAKSVEREQHREQRARATARAQAVA
jgi:hypothetical protein